MELSDNSLYCIDNLRDVVYYNSVYVDKNTIKE